jgi:hypothetical protein
MLQAGRPAVATGGQIVGVGHGGSTVERDDPLIKQTEATEGPVPWDSRTTSWMAERRVSIDGVVRGAAVSGRVHAGRRRQRQQSPAPHRLRRRLSAGTGRAACHLDDSREVPWPTSEQEMIAMFRRRAMRRMIRRRRRRRLIVGGMLIVGTASAMRKMTQQDAEKIQQTTGKPPEEMEPEELDRAMAQAGIQSQPVTPEDQQAMATAEANDPDPDEEVEAPE